MAMQRTTGPSDAAALRQQEAYRLHLCGWSYRRIGAELQVSHEQARQDVIAALRDDMKARKRAASHERSVQLARLDAMLSALWPQVEQGDPTAIAQALRVEERRAKLTGTEMPTKVAPTTPDGTRAVTTFTLEIDSTKRHGDE